jgi:hypothetical protein
MIEAINNLRNALISLFKPFAQFCFNLVKPVSSDQAILIYILVLAAVALWASTLKQEKQKKEDWEKQKKEDWPGKSLIFHDLRLWAVLILVLQIGFYVIFR